ncbi:MAG TPA: SDR family oxidoreductase [Bacilli bacterium]
MNSLERSLDGKLIVVTGAGSGLGKAISIGLAGHGAVVVLVGRRAAKLHETQAWIESSGGKAFPITADVGNPDDVEVMGRKVLNEYGVPSIVINGAGIHGEMKQIKQSNPAKWIETFMINTVGTYLVCRVFIEEMIKSNQWGRIINISSAASLHPPSGLNSAYGASKAALNHFTRQLAEELTCTGVTANAIHPGEVKTEMWAAIREDAIATKDRNILNWVEMVDQTGGDAPEKTVKLILDLIRAESDPINGQFLWIEDGMQEPIPSWNPESSLLGAVWMDSEQTVEE